tara:strand:- start:683 stop:958 length:276 start_codon:yes stop_codon:yes gene_type:complete
MYYYIVSTKGKAKMKNIDVSKLGYAKEVDFKKVLEDGISIATKDGADGFSYKVGEINGMDVIITLEPSFGMMDTIDIDGVDGFGYTLVFEK